MRPTYLIQLTIFEVEWLRHILESRAADARLLPGNTYYAEQLLQRLHNREPLNGVLNLIKKEN